MQYCSKERKVSNGHESHPKEYCTNMKLTVNIEQKRQSSFAVAKLSSKYETNQLQSTLLKKMGEELGTHGLAI
jgi:hypothetical protein